jgi:DNA-binding transcriptional ArsR family regulator
MAKTKGRKQQAKSKPKSKALQRYAAMVNGVPPEIVKALNHETRRAILGAMADHATKHHGSAQRISPNELAYVLEERLNQISYHVKVLLDECKVIKPAGTEPRRGAVEHYYVRTAAMERWMEAATVFGDRLRYPNT